MTPPCHAHGTSLDTFDPLEEPVDDAEQECYALEDNPFCDFNVGDSEGFCTKNRYGCSVLGCSRNG